MSDHLVSTQHSPGFNGGYGEFTAAQWESLTETVGAAFNMDGEGVKKLRTNAVLKLVGALPYLADCDEPERTALAHMSTFIMAGHPAAKSAFSHNFKDSADVERRLEPISHFGTGNQIVVDWGMKLLMIAMINDHIHDAAEDEAARKLNPVNAGHWDGKNLIDQIRKTMPVFTEDRFTKLMSEVEIQTYWIR